MGNKKDFWQNQVIKENEAEQLIRLQIKFLKDYMEKEDTVKIDKWLKSKLAEELPDKNDKELEDISNSIIDTIKSNQKNKRSLERAKKRGISKEQWFAKKLKNSTKAIKINEMGKYLEKIDNALLEANTELYNTVINNNGSINQNPNLDGFIAEQFKANTFNLDAAIKDVYYKGEVLNPEIGKTFKKNSLDGQIRDNKQNAKVVRRYQEKFGKNAEATKRAFKKGDYRGQRKGVPADQVDQIEGGNSAWEYKEVKGKGLTKSEAKRLQNEIQEGKINNIKKDWNYYELKNISKNIGKKASFSGLTAAGISVGYDMVNHMVKRKKVDREELTVEAIKTGSEVGVNAALAGAVKVASERGLLRIIPKGTPGATIANIVYTGLENAKVLAEIANGKLSIKKGLDKMGEITTSTTLGAILAAKGTATGAAVGAAALSWIPAVGTGAGAVLGGFVGGIAAYIAGSEVGKNTVKTARKVSNKAKKISKTIVDTGANVVKKTVKNVKKVGESLASGAKNTYNSIKSCFGF